VATTTAQLNIQLEVDSVSLFYSMTAHRPPPSLSRPGTDYLSPTYGRADRVW